jgi:protein TonB
MSETKAQHTFDLTLAGAARNGTPVLQDDRRFAFGLLVAAALHALLFVGFNSGEPRRLGDPSGADDAISVSIITAADLKGRATVDDRAAGLPTPPPMPAPAAEPVETAPKAPPEPPQPPAEPQAEATPETPPALKPSIENERLPEDKKPEKKKAVVEPTPDLLALPDPSEQPAPKAAEAKPEPSEAEDATPEAAKSATKNDSQSETSAKPKKPPAKPEAKPTQKPQPKKTAKLDLSPPAVFRSPVGGGGAGVQRPAGITRSGENDAFARGVIRALQQTMPQLRDTFGRVTVRITLNMQGNLVSTRVLKPSDVAGLDQSVVFATQQSSFPFPPHNAKPVDLVFIVTYIYR